MTVLRPGLSSLQMCCEIGCYKAARLVLQPGDDSRCVDLDEPISLEDGAKRSKGKTPLHLALENGGKRITRLLLQESANVHARDGYLRTPLHYCLEDDLVDELVTRGVDVNALSVYRETPAFKVFRESPSPATFKAFLKNGADMNIEDISGETPFTHMSYLNYDDGEAFFEVMKHVKSLEVFGAPVNPKNRDMYRKWLTTCKQNHNYNETDFIEECGRELERMKSLKIDGLTTLYDFIFKDSFKLARHCENPSLREIVENAAFETDFPIYGYLVKLQLKKGFTKRTLLKESAASYGLLIGQWLGSVCSEMIFEFLSDDDLRNLIEAASDLSKFQ